MRTDQTTTPKVHDSSLHWGVVIGRWDKELEFKRAMSRALTGASSARVVI